MSLWRNQRGRFWFASLAPAEVEIRGLRGQGVEGQVFFVTSLECTAGGRFGFASPAAAEIEVRGLQGQAMEGQVFVVMSFKCNAGGRFWFASPAAEVGARGL